MFLIINMKFHLSRRNSLEAIFLVLMIICFGIQIKDCLIKYFKKNTITTNRFEVNHNGIPFPVISFCPGIKKGIRARTEGDIINHNRTLFETLDPQNIGKIKEDDIVNYWKNVTYKIEDVLLSVKNVDIELSDLKRDPSSRGPTFVKELNLTLDEFSTTFGRCYSLQFHNNMREKSQLVLKFNISTVKSIDLFFHEPFHEIGLFNNYWPGEVHFEHLDMGRFIDIMLKKRVVMRDPRTQKCNANAEYNLPNCVVNFAKKEYMKANCSQICAIPRAEYITRSLNISFCVKRDDYICMIKHLRENIIPKLDQTDKNQCDAPCNIVKYLGKMRYDPIGNDDKFMVWIMYETTNVLMEEEVEIYDPNDVISAVGGSLGLFLGFSCLSSLRSITEFLERRFEYFLNRDQIKAWE